MSILDKDGNEVNIPPPRHAFGKFVIPEDAKVKFSNTTAQAGPVTGSVGRAIRPNTDTGPRGKVR